MKLVAKLTQRTDSARGAIQEAAARKTAATETLEEAWQRILSMKNSEPDQKRLLAVREAMLVGKIGRDPAAAKKRFSKAEALRLYQELALLERDAKIAELVANMPSNFVLVTNEQQLREIVDVPYVLLNNAEIAVDVETTGVDVYIDQIVGVSLTLPHQDKHYYIPFEPTQDARALPAEALQLLKPLMEAEQIGKVLHNALFDRAMFERHGIALKSIVWDTMTAQHCLQENEPSFALKNLATKYLGEPADTFAELFGKEAKFETIPLDVALAYAAKDTQLTWKLYQFQKMHMARFPEILDYYKRVEVPLLAAVYDMERTGFLIDVDYAKQYGDEMAKRIESMRVDLMAQLGDININSGQQLQPVLERLTGEKLPNLDAKQTLKPLAKKHKVIADLLEYREQAKLYSTYISVLPEKVHPITNRLHARFNVIGTKTGRFSSGGNGVNLQNQPYEARKLFKAPPGFVIIGADWSQQEVRCAAYFTQEPVLLSAYAEGRDVYTSLASEFYGLPPEQCGDGTKERKAMKVAVLAALYGTGPSTMAQQLGCSTKEAREFIDEFFRKMPRVKKWIDDTKAFARKNGFVYMDRKQRKRRLPDAKKRGNSYDNDVQRALRQGPNAVIQGTSAIQSKTTIVAAHDFCRRKGWRLWCTVHDELLVLAPEDFTREDLAEFERVMVDSYVFGNVPNKTDIEIMKRWGEGESVEAWFAARAADA